MRKMSEKGTNNNDNNNNDNNAVVQRIAPTDNHCTYAIYARVIIKQLVPCCGFLSSFSIFFLLLIET